MPTKAKRSSELLLAIADNKKLTKTPTFQDILDELGAHAFGIALLFFALPSALPFSAIPGVSAIFSIPIIIFSVQIIIGRKTLWLPKFIANRTMKKTTIQNFIHKTVPWLAKIEYFLKPRLAFMTSRFMEIINGIIIFCLAVLLTLPIPMSNFILAILLIIFSLGLIEKDGIFLLLGYVGTILYLSFIYVLIAAAIKHILS